MRLRKNTPKINIFDKPSQGLQNLGTEGKKVVSVVKEVKSER